MTPWLLLCCWASAEAVGGLGELKGASEELTVLVKTTEQMAREKAREVSESFRWLRTA